MNETRNFPVTELICTCGCNQNYMNMDFLTKLQELRDAYNKPMILSSAYRCPAHNNNVSGTGMTGPHTTGRAVDVKVYGKDAHTLIGIAFALGFAGIGVNQSGDHSKRFIHLDDLRSNPRPWIWSY